MDVNTNTNAINTRRNDQMQVKEVQPPNKPPVRNNEAAPKPAPQPVADKVSISAQGIEAQRKNESVRVEPKQTQTPKSIVNTVI